jgi:hypothetical protein
MTRLCARVGETRHGLFRRAWGKKMVRLAGEREGGREGGRRGGRDGCMERARESE